MKFLKEFAKVEAELNKIDASKLPTMEVIAAFIALRPTLTKLLKFIQIFTGDKADAVIDKVIAWMDDLDKK